MGSGNAKKEISSIKQTRIDTFSSTNTTRGGHLPHSQVLHTNPSSEDMSYTEVYGGRYSLDSASPQDDRVPSVSNSRYNDPVLRRPQYHVYTSDLSSVITRGANSRYPVNSSVYREDKSDDSLESSEYSTTQVGASIENLPRKDAYASHVSSRVNVDISSRKDLNGRNIQNRQSSMEYVPSAPPIPGSYTEIKHKQETLNSSRSVSVGVKTGSGSFPTRFPTFHASSLGPSHAFIAYEACVRLCVDAWAKGCMVAPYFLENECALLRSAFSLQQVLLQSKEERSSGVGSEGAAPKQKKMVGKMKMKVQVRKVKMSLDPSTRCCFSSIKPPKLKLETVRHHFAIVSTRYMQASTRYIKQVSGLLKDGVSTLRSSSSAYEVQETYSCQLRLKSSAEGDTIRMQPGSGETHIFFPDSLRDDLIVEVQDSKGNQYGRVLAQVAAISEVQNDKLRWWSVYREPEHEVVGKVQLYINYTTSLDENGLKCGSIAETMAYDLACESEEMETKKNGTSAKLEHLETSYL